MDKLEFIELACSNSINATVLDRLNKLNLPDAWLVSGALFQTVWNRLTGRAPEYGIKDYDIIYFDGDDLSVKAETQTIQAVQRVFNDMDINLDVRNQARVHLWYSKKFSLPYAPLKNSTQSIDRYLAQVTMVGLGTNLDGDFELYAPMGLDDLTNFIVRPNPSPNFSPEHFRIKARRWQAKWPEVTVI